MNRILPLILLLLFARLNGMAQASNFVSDSLDQYISKGMHDWDIPGLAIAVIKDGKILVMKGYGESDRATHTKVDENTLFMIASNSKLFTATSLAQLEADKKLTLNDPVTKYFPGFRLYNNETTRLVTIRDMLSHHLGTKTFQGDFVFWNGGLSRSQIMNKMQLLKPTGLFRQDFGYCNSCFLTAGEIIPKVSGKPWEVYVYDSIIVPLGMTNTHTLTMGISQRPNVSKPYTNAFTGTLQQLPYDQVDNLAPAGSIVSCIKDMSKWIMMQLDSGRYNGKQVLPWPVISRTREMSTIISSTKSNILPTHFTGYGLGVFMTDYNGKQVYWHTGGAFGFVTNTCFVPEEKLGIIIFTNNDNQNFFEALRYQILDAYLGMPYVNRSNQFLTGFLKQQQQTVQSVEKLKRRVKGNLPPIPLENYTGEYMNDVYGPISINKDNDGLLISFNGHRTLKATLRYMDNDEWLMTYNNPAFGIFGIRFTTENNQVKSVEIKVNDFVEYDPYLFTKK